MRISNCFVPHFPHVHAHKFTIWNKIPPHQARHKRLFVQLRKTCRLLHGQLLDLHSLVLCTCHWKYNFCSRREIPGTRNCNLPFLQLHFGFTSCFSSQAWITESIFVDKSLVQVHIHGVAARRFTSHLSGRNLQNFPAVSTTWSCCLLTKLMVTQVPLENDSAQCSRPLCGQPSGQSRPDSSALALSHTHPTARSTTQECDAFAPPPPNTHWTEQSLHRCNETAKRECTGVWPFKSTWNGQIWGKQSPSVQGKGAWPFHPQTEMERGVSRYFRLPPQIAKTPVSQFGGVSSFPSTSTDCNPTPLPSLRVECQCVFHSGWTSVGPWCYICKGLHCSFVRPKYTGASIATAVARKAWRRSFVSLGPHHTIVLAGPAIDSRTIEGNKKKGPQIYRVGIRWL